MKVYRGPKTKDFSDDSHEKVDEQEIKELQPWTDEIRLQVNATKDAQDKERQSVVTLVFKESDIDCLYESLLVGRSKKSKALASANSQIRELKAALDGIKRIALLASMQGQAETIKKVLKVARNALGEGDE